MSEGKAKSLKITLGCARLSLEKIDSRKRSNMTKFRLLNAALALAAAASLSAVSLASEDASIVEKPVSSAEKSRLLRQ
jgi:hypothetical protein